MSGDQRKSWVSPALWLILVAMHNNCISTLRTLGGVLTETDFVVSVGVEHVHCVRRGKSSLVAELLRAVHVFILAPATSPVVPVVVWRAMVRIVMIMVLQTPTGLGFHECLGCGAEQVVELACDVRDRDATFLFG